VTSIHRTFTVALFYGIAFFSSPPARAAGGPELFAKHCASCHGKDGKAQSPAARKLGVKDLSLSRVTDGEIEKQVTEGKKDDRGNLKMPPFKEKLSAEEIKSLIVVVKGFRK
jgi:mono/diheme cytochrome c family protein